GAVSEAIAMLEAEGHKIRLISMRLLLPAQPERLAAALSGVERILIVEQCHGAQFYHYLRGHYDLPGEIRSMAVPGPLMIRPDDVYSELKAWENE
ncbi:MAG: 2-oxoglutarate synthase, partial [Sedimenticola sp.]|nr:2-oxoglutarate synthase [Sedimenticola sp.]